MNYERVFAERIENLKREGRYRTFVEVARQVGEFPLVRFFSPDGSSKKVVVWCSNDYLGMGHHPSVLGAMEDTLKTYGAGAGGTRNISGTHDLVVELEQELADLHQKEAALVFTSGYVANETALCTLGTMLPDCLVLSDSANHASMIEGIRHSKAEKIIFRHNDVAHLEELLSQQPPHRAKLVAFESVYSMEGDISPMREIAEVAKRYNALTYLDETHAVGLYGNRGGGLAEHEGLLDSIDILQGGLGKAYGVVGGFITGSAMTIDVIRSYGTGFIFTTTLPPIVAAGAIASIRHLKQSSRERNVMMQRVASVKNRLSKEGLPLIPSSSHIIPLLVGDSALCKRASDYLLDVHDIYIQPINYPTVPRGTERLRITPGPLHSEAMVDRLVAALCDVWQQLKLKEAA